MAIYCGACQQRLDWPRPPVRTGKRGPCPLCGKEDALGNYSYPDNLLQGMPNEINAEAEREVNDTPQVND